MDAPAVRMVILSCLCQEYTWLSDVLHYGCGRYGHRQGRTRTTDIG